MDISIITPIYKGNQYIPQILKMVSRNIENVPSLKVELIIVNDSPDIELNINTEKSLGFDIIIHHNEKNLGIHGARVAGVKKARGKYILFLDQDDEIIEKTLESQYKHLENNVGVLSNGFNENVDNHLERLYKSLSQQKLANHLKYYFYYGNLIASPGLCLIKKESIPDLWLNNIMEINGADDWLLWVGFLLSGNQFSINPDELYIHKNVGNNTSNDEPKMIESSFEALRIVESSNIKINFLDRLAYIRKLKIRKWANSNRSYGKFFGYLLAPDILVYLFIYKFLGKLKRYE